MSKKIKLYKVTITESFMMHNTGVFVDFKPYKPANIYENGYDDGGNVYVLPDNYGYLNNEIFNEIFNHNGNFCILKVIDNEIYVLSSDNTGEYKVKLKKI